MYEERLPVPALAGLVRAAWSNTSRAAGPVTSVLPDGCSDLIFHHAAGGELSLKVVGVMTAPLQVRREQGRHVALRLHPHAAGALLGEASAYRDEAPDAGALWGRAARELCERLADLSTEEALRALQAFVRPRLRAPDARVVHAVCAFEQRRASLESLAAELNLSTRQVARLFLGEVGVSPRTFARTARLQRTLPLLRNRRLALAEVALLGGFADQAHLTREWLRFTRLTPAAWRAAQVRNVQDDRARPVPSCGHDPHPELSGDDRVRHEAQPGVLP